jgi:hypothetical protein
MTDVTVVVPAERFLALDGGLDDRVWHSAPSTITLPLGGTGEKRSILIRSGLLLLSFQRVSVRLDLLRELQ